MARANFYIMILTILLLIVLGFAIFSLKRKHYKKHDEDKNILYEGAGRQAHAGLTNINLSCFFNACMQMLFSLEEFRTFVENNQSEEMPTARAIDSLFKAMSSGKSTVSNTEYYNTIIKSIGSEDIMVDRENCASQFLELLINRIVKEEADTNSVSTDDFTNVSFEGFEEFRKRLNTIRLFGILVLPTGSPGYKLDYIPVGEGNDAIPLQIVCCIHTKACMSIQDTFNTILRGNIESTPTRMVVHNRAVPKYLILNFGAQGFSLRNTEWIGSGEARIKESRFALVAMNLFRGDVGDHCIESESRHYMSCAQRDGTWYLFNDSSVKKTTLKSLPRDLTVTSAVFERMVMPETL